MRRQMLWAIFTCVLFSSNFGFSAGLPGVDSYTAYPDPPPYSISIPIIFKSLDTPAGSPALNPINNPGGHYSYTLSWSIVQGATSYILEEDDNGSFSSPMVIYSGPNTSFQVSVKSTGNFYYRVKAVNDYGSSGWSNVEAVLVTVLPPTCPTAGNWAGSGYRFAINFRVVWDGKSCLFQSGTGHLTATCHIPGGSTWLMYVSYIVQDTTIQGFHFGTKSQNLATEVSGDFTSSSSAQGNVKYYSYEPSSNATCTLSTTWNASGP